MRFVNYTYGARVLFKRYSTSAGQVPRKVFSAIQPTGEAHLGNYLGALKRWVDLQNSEEYSVTYAIADLHSITLRQDPQELQKNILVMAATILACGIDTDKSIFFQQSQVSQHSELCWILGTLTTVAKLSRLAQFKDKCSLMKEPGVGIFLYPVLQAADVMLYKATHVPVGEDQVQQIHLVQYLINKFNNAFGSKFPCPEAMIDSNLGRIKSLKDPFKKMSKSERSRTSSIVLTDEPDEIFQKVKKAITDCTSQVTYAPKERPGVSNLILIHSGLTGKTPEQIVEENVDLDTGKYKEVLAEVIIEHLKPIREKINYYLKSEEYLVAELEKGAEKAREIAEGTLKEVRERFGLDIYNVDNRQAMSREKAG